MRWRDDIGSSNVPAIYHLPRHYCAVSPARLREDFGMDVQTLLVIKRQGVTISTEKPFLFYRLWPVCIVGLL